MKKYIAGNWKMNKSSDEAKAFLNTYANNPPSCSEQVVSVVCPPAIYLQMMADSCHQLNIKIGAQNCSEADNGALTGEISADMLKSIQIDYCIIGHSERRQFFHETDELISAKMVKLFQKGIIPIICVGETLEQRENNITKSVIDKQLSTIFTAVEQCNAHDFLIAYEPVWAIGTGKTATPDMAREVHEFIRLRMCELLGEQKATTIPILYGGSVKPENIADLLSQKDIDGALIGGASLDAEAFVKMLNSVGEMELC